MATIKSYTGLEQSKKLAEILPLESADYHYITQGEKSYFYPYSLSSDAIKDYDEEIKYIPCWSLAALLDILAKETHNIDEDGHVVLSSYKGNWWNVSPINCISGEIKESNNPLDACYEMLLKLYELNLL